MVRRLYSLLLYLATPLILLRLIWRSRSQPDYRRHLGERWGLHYPAAKVPLIWIHAVSVGETRAAEPLIAALQERFPEHTLLLTGMTPTGREAGRLVFGQRVLQAYLPYDYPDAVRRFLRHFRPRLGILMETEIWPNLLTACQRQGIPVLLANARLSERSARGYARFSSLSRPAFAALSGAAAQTEADASRLRALGVTSVEVCGNLKFDVQLPDAVCAIGRQWRNALGERPVVLAASTREGEEEILLAAWKQLARPDALLLLVPRHPQRFDEIAALLERQGWRSSRRSQAMPANDTAIWLGDSMGEMAAYCTLADIAFIGGSLLPLGGQNLIEAAACGCPLLVGPHTFNFARASEDAIAAGAALRVADAQELVATLHRLLSDNTARATMAKAARAFASSHGGATHRLLEFISQRWDPAGR